MNDKARLCRPRERGRPVRVSLDLRFSRRSKRKEQVLEEMLYYRLALGQPDPDAFMQNAAAGRR
jgi:hypothetical protein